MNRAKQEQKPLKVAVPFTFDETLRFHSLLQATGRKAGPWVRTLVLKALNETESIGDGSGQALDLAKALRGEGQGEAANRLINETASSSGARP